MACSVVGDVLEHADCDQVIVDVAAAVACVHVDCIQHSHEILLTQPIDIVADNQF